MEEIDEEPDWDNLNHLFNKREGLRAFMSAVETAGVNHVTLMRQWGFQFLTPKFFDCVREELIARGFDYDAHVDQFLKDDAEQNG